MKRTLVLYDGECRFCTMWARRWEAASEGKVEYRSLQEAELPPGVSREELLGEIHCIDSQGTIYRGAHAVFRILAERGVLGKTPQTAYEKIPGVKPVAEFCYQIVARNRPFFSWWTRVLCGSDLRRPTFSCASWIFLRLLGLVYFIAFASLWGQLPGLVGSGGILPFADYFQMAREQLGSMAWYALPSVLWMHPGDVAMQTVLAVGMLASLAVIFTVAQRLSLFLCWVLYLSIVSVGQFFLSFQWDVLLLEAGLLSLFLAPRGWWQGMRAIQASGIGRFLLVWLLFRLMFASGAVKLSSGDELWETWTALNVHYFTQPLPNPLSWYIQQLPAWFQKLSCAGMFFIELVFPFFIFGPRRLRLLAFLGLAGFQVLIFLTGNYGFFNLLSFALCVLLLDDGVFSRSLAPFPFVPGNVFCRWSRGMLAVLLVLLSLVPLWSSFRHPAPAFAAFLYQFTQPFHIANGYGLFAVMTRERKEIIVQGSENGYDWKTYEFPFKPGAVNRPPPFAFFYMPRLDWQMWFAALGRVEQNPWFANFVTRLHEGSPPVLKLMESNPFPEKPPQYLRAVMDDYRFTTFQQRKESGAWWVAEPEGNYLREVNFNR